MNLQGFDVNSVVIDTGSYQTKIGYAGDDTPKCVLRSCVGYIPNALQTDTDGDTVMTSKSNNKNGSKNGTAKRSKLSSSSASSSNNIKAAKQEIDSQQPSSEYKENNGNNNSSKFGQFYVDSGLNVFRPNMDIITPFANDAITNTDALSSVWDYGLSQYMRHQSNASPILLSEPSWFGDNQFKSVRESMVQCVFEKLNAPATFLAKDAMLSAFSCGKGTAIVLDCGASRTRVTPIVEGYVLNNGIRMTKCGGDFMDSQMHRLFVSGESGVNEIIPDYCVNRRSHPSQPNKFEYTIVKKENETVSYRQFAKLNIIRDIRENLCRVSEIPFHTPIASADAPSAAVPSSAEEILGSQSHISEMINPEAMVHTQGVMGAVEIPKTLLRDSDLSTSEREIVIASNGMKIAVKYYTLPDGKRIPMSDLRYSLPEYLFNSEYNAIFESDFHSNSNNNNNNKNGKSKKNSHLRNYKFNGLCGMTLDSVFSCDVDTRRELMANVVVTGGHSKYLGFTERLVKELVSNAPAAFKVKAHYPETLSQRTFGTFVGGSILASLEFFQEMWITKAEFEEHGTQIVHKKCP